MPGGFCGCRMEFWRRNKSGTAVYIVPTNKRQVMIGDIEDYQSKC
jgi:hypothetical protein